MPSSPAWTRQAAVAACLGVCYVLNLWLTNVLRELTGGFDTIWTANAFVIGAVLLLPRRWAPACLAAGFSLQVAVILAFQHAAFDAVAYSLLNLVEAIAVVALARRLNVVRLTTPARFAVLVFLVLAPVLLLGAGLLGVVAFALNGEFPLAMVLARLAAKFLGMSLVLPAILLLGAGGGSAIMTPRRWETLGAYLLAAGVAALIFTPVGPIAVMALFPAVTLLAVRTGPRVVTVAVALICAVLLGLGVTRGPPSLVGDGGGLSHEVSLAQVYLAMLFAAGVIPALMATHQQRLRRLLLRRSLGDRRARARAEAASVAKTSFLATMSHEIRTPLNAILGFAQVLDRKADFSAESRHQVGLIRRSGEALLSVVNDILDFSKVEAGRIELDPRAVDIAGVCRDALGIVAESAERKGLNLTMSVEGDLAAAYVVDDHRLCQVLLNFLNNAVKFTDTGDVVLSLSVAPGDELDRLRIAITDTGPGIPAQAQTSLFQRFSQVDNTVSRNHGGTGLGLAICKGLIEAMGGRVGVASKVGQGSTFWLEIRLARGAPAVSAEAEAREADAVGAHILLVDDHPMNRELGVTLLNLLGCTVDVACDGLEAIKAAETCRYDAILMDVHMPGLDGLAATRAIRRLPSAAASTPIIAMSADVLPEQLARMKQAGMIDSVEKPVSIADLHACLGRWVGRDAAGAEIAA
ncbi:ATP-binding protein [Phenylobacterium sp.]|uniref:ATP-binding protein n=1 Tax=Phenylobacterium sp. TaxID=1871053 RepID=UPI00286CA0EA|nr:ATP-binding protein [Phenylobacterium sp.]